MDSIMSDIQSVFSDGSEDNSQSNDGSAVPDSSFPVIPDEPIEPVEPVVPDTDGSVLPQSSSDTPGEIVISDGSADTVLPETTDILPEPDSQKEPEPVVPETQYTLDDVHALLQMSVNNQDKLTAIGRQHNSILIAQLFVMLIISGFLLARIVWRKI